MHRPRIRAEHSPRAEDRSAVDPGYGFLSESAVFAQAVTAGTSGTVDTVHVQDKAQVEPGDPVVAMTPAPPA